MKNKNTEVDYRTTQIPQSLWQAGFHLFWPLSGWWKKAVFVVIIIIFVAVFAIWASLPERTKTEIIDCLKGSEKAQSPVIVTHDGKGSSAKIQGGYFDASKKTVRPVVPKSQGEHPTQGPSQEGIQQHTEGDQSPAVISNGDVNINIGAKDTKRENE